MDTVLRLLPREQLSPCKRVFITNSRALNALGMETGLSHMEWFSTAQNGPVISEVGARPPGVNIMPMMGHAHGVDMWQQWAQLLVHETWDMPERQAAVGCAFLRAQGGGQTVTAVHGLNEAQAGVEGMVSPSSACRATTLLPLRRGRLYHDFSTGYRPGCAGPSTYYLECPSDRRIALLSVTIVKCSFKPNAKVTV